MADTQTITALAALLCADCEVEISAENMTSAITAAGCSVPDSTVAMYAAFVEKAGGVDKFMQGPGSGGGGAAAPAAAAGAAPAAEAEKPKEEEVDAFEGGMDMFGGGGGDY